MKKYTFLYRIKNCDDRDACAYIENKTTLFSCGHYFSGINLHGACYCGNDFMQYDEIETILSVEEYNELILIDKELSSLGYGIKIDDIRYKKGMELCERLKPILDKLNSQEATQFFEKIIEEEKEIAMDQYNLSKEEIDEVFDNYFLDYQDRSIIGAIYYNYEELGEEYADSIGLFNSCDYSIGRHFNYESFGQELCETGDYYELPSGKIIYYMA